MPRLDYDEKLVADNAAAAKRSRSDRDISRDYPTPGDLSRRADCERDLRRFCEEYFPNAFRLAWSDDHLKVIARMEEAVLDGGLFGLAMPRGSGKSTISIRAAIWALLYGHRRFVCLVGATEKRAGELLKAMKVELTLNEQLTRDFRQVCYPLKRLENNARRCIGQLFGGEPTRIEWAADRLTLPTMPDADCDGPNVSGSTVSVVGLTGALRGQSHTLATGEIIRPELVILDDVQTRESAMSASQSQERAAIVAGDVLGMAGPDRTIAAIMPCTIIRAGDTADTILNRETNPRWRGERCKMLNSFPANEKLWEQYGRIRAESHRKGGNGSEATAFYAAHRAEMDAGAVAAWPARFRDDEISAVQCAMNLKLDDEQSFMAEYQNEPIRLDQGDGPALAAEQVAGKTNGIGRGIIPIGAEHITAFIDVHDSVLYYVVAAWSSDFTGWVVDYSTLPEQHRSYFTLRKAPRTLASVYRAGKEGNIRAGLDALTGALLARKFEREDGARMSIERCLIDAGYVGDVVQDACRHSVHSAVLLPSRGVGITASGRPMTEYDRNRGDRIGHHWLISKATGGKYMRHFRYDSNYWKSFVVARLAVAQGDPGCLSLWGRDPGEHRMIADHAVAEFAVRTVGQGRAVDEWRTRPDRPDNHYFDGLAGVSAAASLCGAVLPGTGAAPTKRKRYSMADFQRAARERQGRSQPSYGWSGA